MVLLAYFSTKNKNAYYRNIRCIESEDYYVMSTIGKCESMKSLESEKF